MDFFGQQEHVRRLTRWLIGYFLLAVVCIVVGVYGALVVAIHLASPPFVGSGNGWRAWWQPNLFFWSTVATLLVIGSGAGHRLDQLRGGGPALATSLGGRLVLTDTDDLLERQLLNVVEEMAIATGLPVPLVYVLEWEAGINAFAAGHTPADAALGVTRGALRWLSRDQLQGVVAHEFSHILNGDMRLNTRLVGWLSGILQIGGLGKFLLRSMNKQGRANSDERKEQGQLVVVLAVGLVVVGYLGYFWGRLIQAAICRQREYLADAAAVQFTRQVQGLAGALRKAGGLPIGSTLFRVNAADSSHLFFGNPLSSWFSFTATHPPLAKRIRRLDPAFDGQFPAPQLPPLPGRPSAPPGVVNRQAAPAPQPLAVTLAPPSAPLAGRVGRTSEAALVFAKQFAGELPEPLRQSLRQPDGARQLIYALLLAGQPQVCDAQWQSLVRLAGEGSAQAVRGLLDHFTPVVQCHRLLLVSLAASALGPLDEACEQSFWTVLDGLIVADERVTLYEMCLRLVVGAVVKARQRSPLGRERLLCSFRGVEDALSGVLSALVVQGKAAPAQGREGFAAAVVWLGGAVELRQWPGEECTFARLQPALAELSLLAPSLKRQLVNACAAAVGHDGQVTPAEAELLRAVCAVLGCPLPPNGAEESAVF